MAIKKSELYSSLWQSCDELRGGMDASQYKDYVLVLLFVKYVSDKYSGQKGALLDVPKGGSFADMVKLKGDKEIGDKINKIIGKLAAANDLRGVIDVADFNDSDKLGRGKEMVDRLSNLIGIFDNPALDFRANRTEGDDLLGDAYEFLMRHFATESGKSKGQFYTPAEVSRVMAKVIGVANAKSSSQTIHDPTCGSGSLLLKAHDEAKSRTGLDLALYGQEMDNATAALARMNMILHDCPTAEIWKDNVLANPHFKDKNGKLKTFDFVVANPPFSFKAWSNGFNPSEDEFRRFEFGIPPTKSGDLAFLLHVLACLKSSGKAAVNLPHGVLFRGGAEGAIRRAIVNRGYVKGIISLPVNLFYGTGIPACILVLDKENAHTRKGIFMVDASKGFVKDGNKNRLRAQDIHKIVDIFNRQVELPSYSRMVPLAEITDPKNDFNLNFSRYIDSNEPEDLQDIDAHLCGGIPNRDIGALEHYWQVLPSLRKLIFEPSDRPGYSCLRLPVNEIKSAILGHTEFSALTVSINKLFSKWQAANVPRLRTIKLGDQPKALIENLSESLLETFRAAQLLDGYDVYQHIMDYWADTMQDDVYQIAREGWKAVLSGAPNADLIPSRLILRRYFTKEVELVERLEMKRDAIGLKMEEFEEAHGGEDGPLADARNDKGKLTKASVRSRLGEINSDRDMGDERKMLEAYLTLIDDEGAASRKMRDSQSALDDVAKAKYSKFSMDEIKVLVVDDKWLAHVANDLQSELDRMSLGFVDRIEQLVKRYAITASQLANKIELQTGRVEDHFKTMGVGCDNSKRDAGAKERLLGGKARVPGFNGEWTARPLQDVLVQPATYGIVKAGTFRLAGVPMLRGGDIKDGRIGNELPFVSPEKSAEYARTILRSGDVVIALVGYPGEAAKVPLTLEGANISRAVGLLRPGEIIDAEFLVSYLNSAIGRKEFLKPGAGSAQLVVNLKDLNQMRIPLPSLDEQRAIAAAIGDINSELALLEEYVVKTRFLKQGMMEELLSGRVRLQ